MATTTRRDPTRRASILQAAARVFAESGYAATSVDDVRRTVADYGFRFPVAVDDEWKALRRLWLDRAESSWTSASLLIDREGVVRHVHPGGVFARESSDPRARGDYDEMRAAVETLIAEKETSR